MTTTLKAIISFVNVPAGGIVALPHTLNIAGLDLTPDRTEQDNSNFSILGATATTVTVQNNGLGVDSCNVLCERWHSLERAFGPISVTDLSPQPFIPSTGGSGGGSGLPVIEWHFRPGAAPTAPNMFDDFALMYAAIQTIDAQHRILFDDTFAPCVIPAGAYVCQRWFLQGIQTFGGTMINVVEGVSFTITDEGAFEISLGATLNFTGVTPPFQPVGDGQAIICENGGTLQNFGTGPMISLANLLPGEVFGVLLFRGSVIPSGLTPLIDIPVVGTALGLGPLDGATVDDDVITGVAGTFVFLLVSGVINLTNPGFAGTYIADTQFVRPTRWFPEPTINVAPIAFGFDSTRRVHLFDTSGGAFTQTLPSAAQYPPGETIWFKKVAGAPNLDIDVVAGDSLDGVLAGTTAIVNTTGSLMFLRGGLTDLNWFVLGNGV